MNMKRLSIILILAVFMLSMITMPVRASEPETTAVAETEEDEGQSGNYDSKQTFGIDTEFDGLSGYAKYLGSSYRDNYYLDLERTSVTELMDAAANGLANGLFTAFQMLAMIVCCVVYFCLDFSLADTIAEFISSLQSGMINGVFKQLWMLAVVAMGVSIVGKMFKREMAEIAKDMLMVIFVTILSIMLMTHTNTILTASTNITKSVSNAVFNGLDTATGMDGGDSYAANAAGSLWTDMIHEPWLTLEFGSVQADGDVVEEILSLKPGSADRKDIVKDMTNETGCFNKGRAWPRFGMLLCYFIPFCLKGAVFAAVALLQFLGQFLAVFVILLAAFVLALAIVPSYGADIIGKWMGKFLDVHLSMAILSFLMALMIWLNKVLYSMSGTFGWFISLLFQAVISVILFLNYRTILFLLLHPRDGMSDLNRMMRRMQTRRGYGGGFGGGGRYRGGGPYHGRGRMGYEDYEDYEDEPNYNNYESPPPRGYYDNQAPEQDHRYHNVPRMRTDSHYSDRGNGNVYEQRRLSDGGSDRNRNGYYGRADEGAPPRTERIPEQTQDYYSPADYDAIRNAPTQQELYQMFDDAPADQTERPERIERTTDQAVNDRKKQRDNNVGQGGKANQPKEKLQSAGNQERDSSEEQQMPEIQRDDDQRKDILRVEDESGTRYIKLIDGQKTEEKPQGTLKLEETGQIKTEGISSADTGDRRGMSSQKRTSDLRSGDEKEQTQDEELYIPEEYDRSNIGVDELNDQKLV